MDTEFSKLLRVLRKDTVGTAASTAESTAVEQEYERKQRRTKQQQSDNTNRITITSAMHEPLLEAQLAS